MTTPETSHFAGKRIAIFGGTSGLGLRLAEQFYQEGAAVTVLSRNATKGDEQIPVRRINANVASATSVKNAFEQMDQEGELDIVINAAGRGLRGRASETNPADIADVVNIDLVGVIYTSSEAAQRMEKRGQGIIVNIGSTSGIKPRANESVYVAAKWGITGFTRSLRMEINPMGVAVVLANPGGMDTPFWEVADPSQDTQHFMDPATVADKILVYLRQPNLLATDQEILIERPKQ